MIKNYLVTAFRNLWRNKFFSSINILGLALGITCSLFILLWVKDEKSVDAFHSNADRLFSVYEKQFYDNKAEGGYSTPGVLADELKKIIPEVEFATPYAWTNLNTFAAGEKIIKKHCNQAGIDYFKMFSYHLIEGSANSALNSPVSIAISKQMADDFFDTPANAIGKTIRYENKKNLTVSAVFENLPPNVSDKFDCLINWDVFFEENRWAKEWGNNGPQTFVMLRKDANASLVEKKITHFIDKYNNEQANGFKIELGLQKVSEKYLNSNFKNGKISGGRIEYVKLFSIVALFILLIACINFMNLTTARSVKRAKEIGVRKVAGALKSSLIGQFIGEAVFLAFLATAMALVLLVLLMPFFNTVTGKQIILPFSEKIFWLNIAAIMLITGFISGSYPALFLSSFKPAKVLKGLSKFSTATLWLRKGLVVLQFTLSIILIVGTIIVSKQVEFIQTRNLGFDRENMVYIPMEGDLGKNYSLFKQLVSQVPGVKSVSHISQNPGDMGNSTGGVEWDGKEPNTKPQFVFESVGYDFVKTIKLKLLNGRDFSKDIAGDSAGFIINESALAKIGYKDPVGKQITMWKKKGPILGILKDFHFNSLHDPINPLILVLREKRTDNNILVRTEAGRTKQVLALIGTICKKINPQFPFTYQFSDEQYAKLYKSELMVNQLCNCFAFLAIFISCLGLLGLAIFTSEQRIKEIGIRKVLGASVGSLFALLSKDFLLLVSIAFVIAVPLAWLVAGNWLKNFAYRVNISWWVFAVAGIMALMIALLTVSFQSIKAALANPVKSLRTE